MKATTIEAGVPSSERERSSIELGGKVSVLWAWKRTTSSPGRASRPTGPRSGNTFSSRRTAWKNSNGTLGEEEFLYRRSVRRLSRPSLEELFALTGPRDELGEGVEDEYSPKKRSRTDANR